ncbi:MAG: FAD-dependent oxidoreductase, partial [Sphaerochaetaceae bacterium]
SASATHAFFRPDTTCRSLETWEVDKLAEAFGKAAEIVRDAGFDGIEVHGHEGYLIDQFVTKIWNKREDKYGGDLNGRLTFPKNILKAIKEAVGDELTVIYRYGGKHFLKDFNTGTLKADEIEAGRDLGESIAIAKKLESAGYDGLHIDCGCYESVYWAHPPTYMPEGVLLDYSSSIKKAVNIPVIGVGKLGNPAIAESALAEKKIDMIALGRDLLSDPQWPNKVFLGKEKEIRRCIGCHECMYLAETGKYLTCAVNPFCGNESIVTFKKIEKQKNIAIIGGGVAGMEAARILKIRGHNVEVFERKDHLGGHLLPAAKPEFKSDLRYLVDWYEQEMKKQQIIIHLNKEFSLDDLDDKEFDVYIVATGSESINLNIKGIDKSKVASSIEIINEEKELEGKIAVVGGGVEGCETAIWLASKGKKVIIIEKLKEVARGIHRANRAMLLEMLKEYSIPIYTSATAMEINGRELKIYNQESKAITEIVDGVVISVGMRPINGLYYDLIKRGKVAHLIGDGYKPGKIADAVWQATMLCTEL